MPKSPAKPALTLLQRAMLVGRKPSPSWVDKLPQDLRDELDATVDELVRNGTGDVNMAALSRTVVEECETRGIAHPKEQRITRWFTERIQEKRGAK